MKIPQGFVFGFFSLLLGCQSYKLKTGIQGEYGFYLPASIAFLPFFNISSYKKETEEITLLLENFDKDILGDFQQQTFVNGLSQKLVEKLLETKKQTPLLQKLKLFFAAYSPQKDLGAFYNEKIKNKPEWLLLIKDLSRHTRFSDALFVPFVTSIKEQKINDRGLQISRRTIAISLMLIEVETGDLVWLEKRKNWLSHKHLTHPPSFGYPNYPPWKNFENKIIVKALWKDFPGWQS